MIIINLSEDKYNAVVKLIAEEGLCECERADLLLKYKNLLDYGAISKEEYEKIKSRLLK